MEKLEIIPEYNSCKQRLVAEGWHDFFVKFQGSNDEVSL